MEVYHIEKILEVYPTRSIIIKSKKPNEKLIAGLTYIVSKEHCEIIFISSRIQREGYGVYLINILKSEL